MAVNGFEALLPYRFLLLSYLRCQCAASFCL